MADENRMAVVYGARWNQATTGWLEGGKERTPEAGARLRTAGAGRAARARGWAAGRAVAPACATPTLV
jgi:hypothetical protein